tara:strand:+ start:3958 stop:5037 length:1080 start_codon:yes stop_codon:yes gene_type:complete
MYAKSGDIRCHIELSNYCNAACPMCGRNQVSSSHPHELKIRTDVDSNQLRVKDIKKIFDDRFFETYTLRTINMCGNRGDPATAIDLFEICEYLFSKEKKLCITIATNGGLKTSAYWKKLGKLFSHYGNKSKVTFGVDGLEDTNHIYRQNVIFKSVMRNAQAFIDGGGEAWWQYLVFKHNEHQIGEAKELSEKMGFYKFFIVHTPRFATSQKRDGYKVYSYKGKTYVLETADPDFTSRQEAQRYIDSIEAEEINCKAIAKKEFYIDNGGRLVPCCWIGNSLDHMLGHGKNKPVRDRIMNMYDPDEMNVIKNDLVDTLQHDFITETMPMSWKTIKGDDCSSKTCKSFCSKKRNIRKNAQHI